MLPDALPSLLFVDAEPRMLAALQRLTRELAATRRFAHSARQALALLQEQVPSVLVSAQLLPDLDGLSLLEHVRARHPGVVCALHTALPPARFRPDSGITLLEKTSPPEVLLAFLRARCTP
jgi:CheY-like chemotaxis protein